jgi:hypothetical protein
LNEIAPPRPLNRYALVICSEDSMNKQIVAEAIRRFAASAGASVAEQDDMLYETRFPNEAHPTFIGIEALGTVLSYSTPCAMLPDTELAPTMLTRNWGGVEDTCFYFSVNVIDGDIWFNLETRQFLNDGLNSDGIVSLLGLWRHQCMQAKLTLRR